MFVVFILMFAAYWSIMSCIVGVITRVILNNKDYAHGCFAWIRLGFASSMLGYLFKNALLAYLIIPFFAKCSSYFIQQHDILHLDFC